MATKIREIRTKEDLPEGTVYYSEEYERRGNDHYDWTNFYDSNFELIGSSFVRYSNTLEGLQRIVSDAGKNDTALMAYDIVDLGNGFCKVNRRGDTAEALMAMCESIKK